MTQNHPAPKPPAQNPPGALPHQPPTHDPSQPAQAPAPPPAEGEDAQAKRDQEAIQAALHPKDFKLAEPGSKDYVAGQPTDEKELAEVTLETEKRMKAGHDPQAQGGTTHEKTVQQYGPEGDTSRGHR